jgi:hypothetical protein
MGLDNWRFGSRTKHGKTKTAEWSAWLAMRQRCQNPGNCNFPRYGARGIKVCDRWQKFENFLADVGVRPTKDHSIDRINNEGGYEPSNVRWATRSEQQHNKRTTRLNPEAVKVIRAMASRIRQGLLADLYSVDPSVISRVAARKEWASC